MLCVVCPHCHQMMTAPEDAVGESVACPGCKKSLQVPPNAPRLPKHLSAPPTPAVPSPAPVPMAQAKAAAAAPSGRAGAAVAAPPAPAAAPAMTATTAQTRSTLPKGVFVAIGVLVLGGIAAAVIIPRLGSGGRKAVVSKKKDIPNLPSHNPGRNDPIPASDLTSAALFRAYFDNALAADENYKDKEVTLAGRSAAVGGQDEIFLDLQGVDRARDQTKIVRCYFPMVHKDRLTRIVYNQPVKLRGTCKGLTNGRVILRDCSFVSDE